MRANELPKHLVVVSYGLAFSLLSGSLVVLGLVLGGPALIMLWPAVSFAWLALAYFTSSPERLGKSATTGKIRVASRLVMAPFYLLTEATWHLFRLLSSEDAHDELTEDIYIGRRPLRDELPADVRTVVDLTAEFEPAAHLNVHYVVRPILDGTAPPAEALLDYAREVSALSGPILIHCAQGHGRTSMVAAAVLLVEGSSPDVDDALQRITRCRPLAVPNGAQRRALIDLAELLTCNSHTHRPI